MKNYVGQGIAERLGKAAGLETGDREVVAYGLEYLLSNIIGLVIIITSGLLLRMLPQTLAVMLGWGLVRRSAGGAHCSTLWRCAGSSCLAVVLTILITRMVLLTLPSFLWVTAAVCWSLAVSRGKAPVGSRQKPLQEPQLRQRLKQQTLLTEAVLAVFAFSLAIFGDELYSPLAAYIASGMAAETIMLTSTGFLVTATFDKFWDLLPMNKQRGGEKL